MIKESKYAIFNFEPVDENLIKGLGDYLDAHAIEICDFFEIKVPEEKVVINIIPSKKEFDDWYRKRLGLDANAPVPDWIIGNCNDQGVITYLSLNDYNSTISHSYKPEEYEQVLAYYKKTIVHEYVHFIHKAFNKIHNCIGPAKYLGEGIACYLSKQREDRQLFLKSSKEKIANSRNVSYDDYYLITKYIVEHNRKEDVLKIFRGTHEDAVKLLYNVYDKIKDEENETAQTFK